MNWNVSKAKRAWKWLVDLWLISHNTTKVNLYKWHLTFAWWLQVHVRNTLWAPILLSARIFFQWSWSYIGRWKYLKEKRKRWITWASGPVSETQSLDFCCALAILSLSYHQIFSVKRRKKLQYILLLYIRIWTESVGQVVNLDNTRSSLRHWLRKGRNLIKELEEFDTFIFGLSNSNWTVRG